MLTCVRITVQQIVMAAKTESTSLLLHQKLALYGIYCISRQLCSSYCITMKVDQNHLKRSNKSASIL
eukprot:c34349_g1_i1 orf=38-238(-)